MTGLAQTARYIVSTVLLGCLVRLVELLVPRTSSTLVSMWSWQTWVVESDT
jgi:hypothetical protein